MEKSTKKLKIVFLGCTKFSEEILSELISKVDNVEIKVIFSTPKKFKISYSKKKVENFNYSNLEEIAKVNNIDYYQINHDKGEKITDFYKTILSVKPDIILVMGWYYMVPKKIREIAKLGAWGIHASLLPNYAGGAPLVWAMINGEKKTGVSLFKLENGVDDGDIISQKEFDINDNDNISDVYEKAIKVSKKILRELLSTTKDYKFIPQDKSKIKIHPQRKPEDGKIDFNWSSDKIHDFIRAQTKPYPGAFFIINGKKITIWDAKIENL